MLNVSKKNTEHLHDKIYHWCIQNWPLIFILLVASITRLVKLGALPEGAYIDEAYGAYNAWALMTEGVDDRGYAFPAYFVAWGSGMSALYVYLGYFLFHIFGASLTIYRIPQAIFGILSVLSMYLIGKELYSKKQGWLFAFLLAINPWHIHICRYGLDANLAPAMFFIGLALCIYGMHHKELLVLFGFFFFGLSLYSYVQIWIILPIFLILFLGLYFKKLPGKKIMVGSICILFVMAVPLLLFLAINYNLMPEIITPYFSIPKLPGLRNGELQIDNIVKSTKEIVNVILSQYDGYSHSSSELTGAFYHFTSPFIVIGIFLHVVKLFKNWKAGANSYEFVFLIWLISSFSGAMLNENITTIHINMLYIPSVFYIGYGIWMVATITKSKLMIPTVLLALSVSFFVFAEDYFYRENEYFYNENGMDALNYAKSLTNKSGEVTIYMNATYKYPLWLWYEKISPTYYHENVIYCGEAAWQEIESFDQYRYINSEDEIPEHDLYVLQNRQIEPFLVRGYQVEKVNEDYSVAYMLD